jgi:hypothetical protein
MTYDSVKYIERNVLVGTAIKESDLRCIQNRGEVTQNKRVLTWNKENKYRDGNCGD